MRRAAGLLAIALLPAALPVAGQASTVQAQRAQLAAAQQRWKALAIRSYTLHVRWCCSDAEAGYTGRSADGSRALTVIRGHARHHARTAYFGRLATVADLFRAVRRAIGGHDFQVRYSSRTGLPLSLGYDTANVANSRRSLRVTRFQRLG
jgi:hypothetical protein